MGWSKTIDLYESWGMQMIRLDPFAANPRDRGKKPLDTNWTADTYPKAHLLVWAMQGGLHNLGVRLGPLDLLIDVDPRNGGDESYTRLLKDSGANLDAYPTVRTGGGGLHIYTRVAAGVPVLSNEISLYPGVEYKHRGQQVVTPGSLHPDTGIRYAWENDVREQREAPSELLEFLAKYQYTAPKSSEIAAISPEDLTDILDQLPVDQYSDHSLWFAVLAASYHATAGTGCDEFIAWSTSDPSYSEHGRKIASRWRSLEGPATTPRSLGSLVRELKKHGGRLPESLSVSHKNLLSDYKVQPGIDIGAAVSGLGPKSTAADIQVVLRHILQLDALEAGDILDSIRRQTGRTKTAIGHALKALKEDTTRTKADAKMCDVPYDVANNVLERHFESGKHLLHATDGRYWQYNGTHWDPYSSDRLKNMIKTTAEQFRESNPAIKFLVSNTIVSAEVVVRAATATGVDLLGTTKAPPAVVNCSNCELWVDVRGNVTRKKHAPESHLTHCLPIEYDPESKSTLFDDTLEGIFAPLPDRDRVIQHLWEVIGYVVQPDKPIPAWFLFQGGGSNGKSLILDVLIALLGPAARPIVSISELSASRSEFAMSEVVGALAIIDDDVKKGVLLNDDILKKLSENKTIRARFLRQNPFSFRNAASVILASNGWPQTSDLSNGMMRRVYGFPFRKQFAHDGDRKKKIINTELAGILNKALEGLVRLKTRGTFDVPDSCRALVNYWAARSNQILGYLDECHEGGRWAGYKEFALLWEGYQYWSTESGYKRGYSRPGFREALISYGLVETPSGVRGLDKK